ncbi:ATP-dependent helicase [Candidatus Solirubrobacter pratensis]|uniref:ATP-dependent helicase n=1 Tax=Candidatus Solirubrobacter pratensis TaxID=1298857 RepID=UPI0018C95E66|nr:ATP-dependent DNA helicase [Candidatus Solirubrobacter pratensis]
MPVVLTSAQREAVEHAGGPLLVLGGAGTGKTTALVERFAHLAAPGGPEPVLALTYEGGADALRERVEDRLAGPYEELSVTTFSGLCARLLRDEALEAGIDPFATPVAAADRLAMLLEHIDSLPLRHHDLRGNPSATLGAIVLRIDRLKDELISAADYAAWAGTLPEDARGAREREFAALYARHDALLEEAGALDTGDLVLHAFRLLREKPHVRARLARRYRHVLVDELQDTSFAQGLLLRLLVSEHGGISAFADDDQTIHRFRGAATKNVRDFRAEWPLATVVRLGISLRSGARVLTAARAVVEPIEDRLEKELEPLDGAPAGEVAFWRCASDRAQAQAVATDVERLIARQDVAPEDVCVLVHSVRAEGQAVAVAFEERAVPYHLSGAAAFFQRAEVRDLLAWLRLLVDPGDAGAVVRALARPPVELRAIDLARVTQIARRRKLDMVAALSAALESPQIPPEARERIVAFLKLYRAAAAALDSSRPDLYVHRLVERLGLRRQLLFAASTEVVERLRNLARFAELAAAYVRRAPQATAREFATSIAAVADAGLREDEAERAEGARGVRVMSMHDAKGHEFDHVYVLGAMSARMPGPRRQVLEPIPDALIKETVPPMSRAAHAADMRRLLHVAMTRARRRLVVAYPERTDRGAVQQPSPFAEEARAAVGGEWEEREEELFGPAETLQSTFRLLRDELLTTVSQVGGRLGELRFDTDLDVSHAVVRYLELLKLAALLERTRGNEQSVADVLPEVNARLLASATSEQREIFETSALDDYLLDAERDERLRQKAVAARTEPSLETFLPRRGDGLVLSATDIETYRTCPLKYKFARVFRIPSEPTMNQRFGILVHQVLERYHAGVTSHGGQRGDQGDAAGAGSRRPEGETSLPELLGLLEAGWRRGGFGDSEEERQFRAKATQALVRYHDRFREDDGEPVWFEKGFAFRMGPHLLRGRVDRVDRLPDGGYELIDYKTGRPKSRAQLREDVQLSLYAVGARESWQLDAASQAYYYVLDDEKVPVERSDDDRDWITETVFTVADGILGQGFEPTPSWSACSMCDYRIACPAAER